MLPENNPNLDNLAKHYFIDELGLRPEEAPEASRNLVGAFEVLFRIQNRLKQQSL